MNTVEPAVGIDAGADAAVPGERDAATAPIPMDDLRVGMVRGRLIFDKHNNRTNVPGVACQLGFVGASASTLTDDTGAYVLAVPPSAQLVLRAPLGGTISVQRALENPISSPIDLHVLDIDAYVGAVSRVHGNFDMFDHGAVAVRFAGSARGGYRADLGAVHGGAFVYTSPSFANPVESTATLAAGDSIYFYAVDPGLTTLTLTSPSGLSPCRDSAAPGATRYEVVAGTMTEIVLSCP